MSDGDGIIIFIYAHRQKLVQFNSDDFDECEFLSVLIKVFHLLISLCKIGRGYAAIVRYGMKCEGKQLEEMQYLVFSYFLAVTEPKIPTTGDGHVPLF